jgi:hypothetical protein
MKHVAMFSGGIGSWATANRVAHRQHGADDLILLFADVKGDNPSPHVGEDPDVYRFIKDAAQNVGAPLVTVKDGRDIWRFYSAKREIIRQRGLPMTMLNTETCDDSCWECGDGIERIGRGWHHCDDVLPTNCTWGFPYSPHCGTEHEDGLVAESCRDIQKHGE